MVCLAFTQFLSCYINKTYLVTVPQCSLHHGCSEGRLFCNINARKRKRNVNCTKPWMKLEYFFDYLLSLQILCKWRNVTSSDSIMSWNWGDAQHTRVQIGLLHPSMDIHVQGTIGSDQHWHLVCVFIHFPHERTLYFNKLYPYKCCMVYDDALLCFSLWVIVLCYVNIAVYNYTTLVCASYCLYVF